MKMKKIVPILFFAALFSACRNTTIGYLKTNKAEYVPNNIVVWRALDRPEDERRIKNSAPWVSPRIQGVLGTAPLIYEFAGVKVSDGGKAEIFSKEINVRGGGIMELPLHTKSPKGHYLVSVKVYNDGHEAIIKDAFTFIIK